MNSRLGKYRAKNMHRNLQKLNRKPGRKKLLTDEQIQTANKHMEARARENRNPAPVYSFVNVQNIKGVVTLAAGGNRRERVSTQGW